MPESSLAFAANVTVPLTVAPFAGAVIETLGGVRSAAPPAREQREQAAGSASRCRRSPTTLGRRLGEQRLRDLRRGVAVGFVCR